MNNKFAGCRFHQSEALAISFKVLLEVGFQYLSLLHTYPFTQVRVWEGGA